MPTKLSPNILEDKQVITIEEVEMKLEKLETLALDIIDKVNELRVATQQLTK